MWGRLQPSRDFSPALPQQAEARPTLEHNHVVRDVVHKHLAVLLINPETGKHQRALVYVVVNGEFRYQFKLGCRPELPAIEYANRGLARATLCSCGGIQASANSHRF